MNTINKLPFPALRVNRLLEISEMSDTAYELFGPVADFGSIVDVGSQDKTIRLINETVLQPIELVLKTKKRQMELFAVSIYWHGNDGLMQCFKIGNKLESIMKMVQQHQERLARVDFELLEQKEMAERHLNHIIELSAPLIPLSDDVALVPLFGNLDAELIETNSSRLTAQLYEHDFKEIVFDLNGIDQIHEMASPYFHAFLETIHLMGIHTNIVGVKPQHARLLKDHQYPDTAFLISLKNALEVLT